MKRYIAVILTLVMLLTLCPLTAFAASSMNASDGIKDYIKNKEGLRLTAYKATPGEEYYTIGYGHYGADVTEGMTITEAEADAYFDQDIQKFVDAVNGYNDKYSLSLSQNEFDALVSLTYNFGTNWVTYYSGSWRLAKYVQNNFKDSSGNRLPDQEIADAFGVLSSAGGTILEGLIVRRIEEAKIFLYGDYAGTGSRDFVYVILNANGGTLQTGNRVVIYTKGQPYGSMPVVTKSGSTFSGWKDANGIFYTASSAANANRKLTAVWDGAASPSDKFTDVPSNYWAKSSIDYVVSKGLFNGVTETTFCPEQATTRAMIVTVLYRLAGSPSVAGYKNTFSDLDNNAYYDAILWAANNNITTGYDDGTFRPYQALTRQQLAAFLMRYASLKGYDTSASADLSGFADLGKVSGYAVAPMKWAVSSDIIHGYSDTELGPTGNATRAQVATMITRFVSNVVNA